MADITSVTIPIEAGNISPISDLGKFVGSVSGVLLTIAGIACMVFLAWGGIEWVMSGGDKGKLEEAKNKITNAVLGLAITAAAWAIFTLIDYFLGLNIAGKESSLEAPSTSTTSTKSTSSSPSSQTCAGGAKIGDEKTGAGGVKYTCVAKGTRCGSKNPNGYNYAFFCATTCLSKPNEACPY